MISEFKSSVVDSLTKSIREEAENETQRFEVLSETITFGKYYQTNEGIYLKGRNADEKMGNVKILSVKVHIDKLKLFEPKIDMVYQNLLYDEVITLENMTKSEIESHIASDVAFKSDMTIKPFIENVLHSDWQNVEYEKGVFIEGFFYHDGKVIDNTANKDLKYTSHDVKDAIKMVNAIISNRGTAKDNDATVMRFMLWSPFSYCLKQIGFGKANYSLMLYGKPQTSKTGSVSNFSWFYSEPSETDKAVSTLSVFGSRLEESTLPSLVDEAKSFLSEKGNHDAIKRSIYSEYTRQTKSKSDNKKIDSYKALSMPIFTYNEYLPIADYFGRRFTLCYYDKSMVVSDEDSKAFDVKYVPNSPKSPLKVLRYLGKEFSKRFILHIERQDKDLMDVERLTVNILKEIASDVGIEFDSKIYGIQESNTDSVIDLKTEIKTSLNRLFRQNHFKHNQFSEYREKDFVACANNGEIPFLYINSHDEFIIQGKSFVDTVSKLVDESLNLDEIMSYLELNVPKIKPITVNGKTIRGFKIDSIDLEWKIFGIRASGRNDDDYEDVIWDCQV